MLRIRCAVVVLCCLTAFGCVSGDIWTPSYQGQNQAVREMLVGGHSTEGLAYDGTPLCYAAKGNQVETVKMLLDMNANVNGGNPGGKFSRTPLHQAAASNALASAKILLEFGADTTIKNRDNQTPYETAVAMGHYEVANVIRDYGQTFSDWEACKRSPSIDCVNAFIAKWPKSRFAVEASKRLDQLREAARLAKEAEEKRIAALRKSQACKLKEENWIYKGKACRNGYAYGKGVAVHVNGILRFEGKFIGGMRTNGVIYKNDEPLFDGAIVDGRPDGTGVCYYNGEPEECRYYKGKRIDALYKQRIEMAAQTRYMEMLKAEIEKLKEAQASATTGAAAPATMSDEMMTALKREAARQITGAIFDQLF